MVRKLTARFVETARFEDLPPRPDTGKAAPRKTAAQCHRNEHRDAAVPGLELRVSRQGAKTWALRYRRKSDGAKRTVTLGAFPEYKLEEARGWAEDQKREIARGEDPAGDRQARKVAHTFKELARDWVKRHGKGNISARALADYESMLARHIVPEIGSMKAVEVRKRDVIALLDAVKAKADARTEDSKTPRKMTHRPNRVFELVRSIFRWGVGRDLLQIDPTAGLKPPIKKEPARERVLSPDEVRTLWAAMSSAQVSRRPWQGKRGTERKARSVVDGLSITRATALAIQLSLVTGQRIGEVVGIAHAELDLNPTAPMWVIPGERTKNGEPNRVPLSSLALKLIETADSLSWSKKHLFSSATDNDKPMGDHVPTKALQRSRKALGLANFRVHDLRRTAATSIAELGYPNAVSLVLNHISVRRGTVTGRVYDQYSYDREKREALNAWGAQLERIIAGKEAANVVPFASHTALSIAEAK